MEITKRIERDGEIIGYIVEEFGIDNCVLSRGLYNEYYLGELIQAGYKYYNYNADEIEKPDGTKISTLPAVDASLISEDELIAIQDMAANAYSDAQCAKYYSYRETAAIEFREPVEITIHTREELVAYLEEVEYTSVRSGFCTDHQPLNSFVDRSALFTLDEVRSDDNIRRLLTIAQKRHKFRDFDAYTKTVEWLVEQGVLTTRTPSYIEFLTAYYAWGFDGIKDSCVGLNTKLAVDAPFRYYSENFDRSNHLANRREELVLWDANENLHFLGTKVNTYDIRKFGREPIVLVSDDVLFQARRASQWDQKYKVYKGFVADVTDRIYMEYISEEGYPYLFKVTHNQIAMFSGNYMVLITDNFSIGSIKNGISYTLDNVHSSTEYYLWNLAMAKIIDIYKNRSMEAPCASTFDMYMKEGVGPKAAIMNITQSLKYNTHFESVNNLTNSFGGRPNYLSALEDYCNPIPEAILSMFGISRDSYDTMEDFLDLAEDVVDNIYEQMSIGKTDEEGCRRAITFYDNVKFVSSCLGNAICINAHGDGVLADKSATILQATKLLVTTMLAENGNMVNRPTDEDVIANFENKGLIDINTVFKERRAAYDGYRVDLSVLRQARAETAWAWMYATKVYREASNLPISEQRHYMMEVVTCTDRKLRQRVVDEVLSCMPESQKDNVTVNCLRMQAPYIAAKLFFSILGGQIGDKNRQGANFVVQLPIEDLDTVEIKISEDLYNSIRRFSVQENIKYITLYDYCKYEFGENGAYSLFLVNGNVTPWRVTPKQGYTIPTYNFLVNYSPIEVFKAFGEEWRNELVVAKGKPTYAIGRLDNESFIPSGLDCSILDIDDYDEETIKMFLNKNVDETVHHYRKRWLLTRAAARTAGKKLNTVPLKQDILMGELAPYFHETVNSDCTYSDDANADDTQCMRTVACDMLQWIKVSDRVGIESNAVKAVPFDVFNYEFSDVFSWSNILAGTFRPTAVLRVSSGAISIICGGLAETLRMSDLTRDTLERFVSAGAITKVGDGLYFAKAFNGNFVLEV